MRRKQSAKAEKKTFKLGRAVSTLITVFNQDFDGTDPEIKKLMENIRVDSDRVK